MNRSQLDVLKALRPGSTYQAQPLSAGELAFRKPARLLSLAVPTERLSTVGRRRTSAKLGVTGERTPRHCGQRVAVDL
jgi:hypothetical protein